MVGANCTTRSEPAFVGRVRNADGEPDSVMARWMSRVVESLKGQKQREGFWEDFSKWRAEEFAEISPGGLEGLLGYFQRKGLAVLDKDGNFLELGDGASLKDLSKTMAAPLAAAKIYMEASGAGIREMASNLLTIAKNGQDPMSAAIAFGKELKAASDAGAAILGIDQELGRSLAGQRRVLPGFEEMDLGVAGPQFSRASREELARVQTEEGRQMLDEILQKLNDPTTQDAALDDLMGLASRAKLASNPLEVFRVASTINMARGWWEEVWVNGLLSSPRTFVTNAMSVSYAMSRPIMQYIPAKITEAVARGIGADQLGDSARVVAAEASAAIQAMNMAYRDAFILGWKGAVEEQDIYGPLVGRSELVMKQSINSKNLEDMLLNSATGRGNLSRIFGGRTQLSASEAMVVDTIGKVVRVPTAAMLGTDTFVKHLSIRGEIAAQAVRRASRDGVDISDAKEMAGYMDREMKAAFFLDGPEGRSTFEKYQLRPDYEGTYDIRRRANENTFQEENALAAKVTELREMMPFLKPFVPFVKTPLNIINAGFNATGMPATFKALKALGENPLTAHLRIVEELAKDPAKSFEMAGQVSTMAGLVAVVWAGVHDGSIMSGGPGRWAEGGKYGPQQRAWLNAMQNTGRVPYGIRTPFGDVPFDRFGEPFALFLKMTADVAHLSSEMDDLEREEVATAWLSVGLGGLYNASFLQGVEDLVKVMKGEDLGVVGQNLVATQMPFGSFLAFVEGQINPYQKMYRNTDFASMLSAQSDIFGNGILGKIASRIPGVGGAPMRIDQVTGQPVPLYPGHGRHGLNVLQSSVPVMPRGEPNGDMTWENIRRVRGKYVESKSSIDEVMTPKERQQWNATNASVTLNGLTFAQWVNRFASRRDVAASTGRGIVNDDQRTGIEMEFDAMKTRYKQAADEAYFRINPSANRRASLLEASRDSFGANDVEGARQYKGKAQELMSRIE